MGSLRRGPSMRPAAARLRTPPRPAGGWIASIREALGLSQRQVGRRMRASGQSIQQLEKAEAEDRITLASLRRVAENVGCELVYVVIPKSGSFADLAESVAPKHTAHNVRAVLHTMALENQSPENPDELFEERVP